MPRIPTDFRAVLNYIIRSRRASSIDTYPSPQHSSTQKEYPEREHGHNFLPKQDKINKIKRSGVTEGNIELRLRRI
uniref:Uncharacterized protein n=1 Tax=Heterorhabditis bacteriophora TaxID=37862 RepID=A0A1I7WN84_HETBA